MTTDIAAASTESPATLLATIAEDQQPRSDHGETTPRTSNNNGTMTTHQQGLGVVDHRLWTSTTTTSTRGGTSTNKRRHSTTTTTTTSWEDVARRGNRFKSFFAEAASDMIGHYHATNMKRLKTTATTTTTEQPAADKENNTTGTTTNGPSNSGLEHLNKLVEENHVENLQLRRKLVNAETERTTLETTQKSLRDEVTYWKNRHGRTAEALRIAEKNAANARHDADLAETTAAQLAQTLQSLQTVVSETKLACQTLAEEQRLVDEKAAAIEHKYLTQKQELMRVSKEVGQLRQSNALLDHARDQWKHERKNMEQQVKLLKGTIATLQRQASDQAAVEELRRERANQDQADLHEARRLLAQANDQHETSARVQTTLSETVTTLEAANADLHEKLTEQQMGARTDAERLHTALSKAEREAQKLRLDKEAVEEELKRTKQDKETSAKQIQELKSRVIAAERLVNSGNHLQTGQLLTTPKASTAAGASFAADDPAAAATDHPPNTSNKIDFRLPPLPGSTKDKQSSTVSATTTTTMINYADVTSGNICCICFKAAFGIMKSCPCGHCQERAHVMCVKQVTAPPSVSHPGTPASPVPVVLCKLGGHRRFSSAAAASSSSNNSK